MNKKLRSLAERNHFPRRNQQIVSIFDFLLRGAAFRGSPATVLQVNRLKAKFSSFALRFERI